MSDKLDDAVRTTGVRRLQPTGEQLRGTISRLIRLSGDRAKVKNRLVAHIYRDDESGSVPVVFTKARAWGREFVGQDVAGNYVSGPCVLDDAD